MQKVHYFKVLDDDTRLAGLKTATRGFTDPEVTSNEFTSLKFIMAINHSPQMALIEAFLNAQEEVE